MKSKGFTLAELIAVIAVLAIILTITVPSVAGMIESSQEKAYDLDLNALERAAKDYFLDENIRINETGAVMISLTDLQTAGVIKEIQDPVSKQACEGYVVIRRNYKTYSFEPYLKCAQNYVSDGYGEMDITSPVISLLGSNPITLNVGSQYSDPGATATDDTDGDISSSIVVTSTVNTNKAGMYEVRYEVKDSLGNVGVAMRNVIIIDEDAPQITLLGHNPVTMNSGDVYADAGATAIDDADGDISHKIIVTGTVNPNVIGTYQITYKVTDSSGNQSVAIRIINVIDEVDPVITFGVNGETTYAKKHITLITVSDAHSGVNSASLKYLWKTNTVTPSAADFTSTFTNGGVIQTPSGVSGGYYLWIIGSDNAGNTVISRSNVFNVDNGYPEITILGDNPTIISVNTPYSDAGATAYDSIDGDLTANISITGTVNPNARGSYTIIYRVTDSSGNEALEARTVQVKDTVPPVIFFGTNGNTTYAKTRSSTVNVTDDHSGVDTDSIKYLWSTSTTEPTEADFFTGFTNGTAISSPVGVTGGYYLWIFAKDRDENIAISKTNVFNLDNTPPVITITGSNPVTHSAGTAYADAGATATDNINGTLTSSIVATGTVNVNAKGSYTITYNVSDSCGNAATAKVRTINVVDDTNPVIAFSMNGNATYAKTRATTVTVTDAYSTIPTLKYLWNTSTTVPSDASFTTIFTNGGSLSTPTGVTGGYYLWILAKDSDNNTTIQRTNVFNLDNTIPVITVTGTNPLYHPSGWSYTDAGATATDNINGNISANISVTGSVNINTVGTYTITYNVSDSSGNAASSQTRTVHVFQSVYTYNYNGSYSTFTAPATGTYKLEVWGAQGSNGTNVGYGPAGTGGLGGYAYGNKTLSAGSNLFTYVGSQSGYNGGGTGGSSGGGGAGGAGGGGTDIRQNGHTLNDRIVVAGGGGGGGSAGSSYYNSGAGGYYAGGGTGGGTGAAGYGGTGPCCGGYNGTAAWSGGGGQTYTGGYGCTNGCANGGGGGGDSSGGTGANYYTAGGGGSFGQGGFGANSQSGYGGAGGGGGGWYGGGGGNSHGSGGGGGGGSSYYGGVSSGGTTPGQQSGNGYARITFISY